MLAISTHQLLAEVRVRARGLEQGTRRLILEMAERLEILDQAGAAPAVLCKDCKYYELHYYCGKEPEYGCANNKGIWTKTPPDAFCYYGERRNDGNL